MRISDCSSDVCSSDLRPSGIGRTKAAMTTTNHPRRLVPASELGLGVRPGAGVLGLSKAEPKVPQEESHSEGTLIVGEGIQVKGEIQRAEEHTSELQSLMRITYAVFCLKKQNNNNSK